MMEDAEFVLRQINDTPFQVEKRRRGGVLEYNLLVDGDTRLYVRMIDNTKDGSYSTRAFKLSLLIQNLSAGHKKFTGTDESGNKKLVADRNDKAFLEVVVNQILPGIVKALRP